MSPTAIGHTGFTGTSLWIDWERDLYFVLLTNRVHPTRENDRLRAIRRAFHDAVMEELDRS
jgi:CubicO group peptidase (beta-lactamase class C family)